jgi:CcmD family protein
MRTLKLAVFSLVLAFTAAGVPVHGAAAQEDAPAVTAEAGAFQRPAGPPRTLRAYWHLFGAFAVTWVLLFGYTVALGGRVKRLERDLETLSG